ncbi:hypothetical protein LguiB_028845 [Lonicera macranthoides]
MPERRRDKVSESSFFLQEGEGNIFDIAAHHFLSHLHRVLPSLIFITTVLHSFVTLPSSVSPVLSLIFTLQSPLSAPRVHRPRTIDHFTTGYMSTTGHQSTAVESGGPKDAWGNSIGRGLPHNKLVGLKGCKEKSITRCVVVGYQFI